MSALDILGVLLGDKDLCCSAVYERYAVTEEELCRHFPCPVPERGLLMWRVRCIAKMIMASDITDIRDETIK